MFSKPRSYARLSLVAAATAAFATGFVPGPIMAQTTASVQNDDNIAMDAINEAMKQVSKGLQNSGFISDGMMEEAYYHFTDPQTGMPNPDDIGNMLDHFAEAGHLYYLHGETTYNMNNNEKYELIKGYREFVCFLSDHFDPQPEEWGVPGITGNLDYLGQIQMYLEIEMKMPEPDSSFCRPDPLALS